MIYYKTCSRAKTHASEHTVVTMATCRNSRKKIKERDVAVQPTHHFSQVEAEEKLKILTPYLQHLPGFWELGVCFCVGVSSDSRWQYWFFYMKVNIISAFCFQGWGTVAHDVTVLHQHDCWGKTDHPPHKLITITTKEKLKLLTCRGWGDVEVYLGGERGQRCSFHTGQISTSQFAVVSGMWKAPWASPRLTFTCDSRWCKTTAVCFLCCSSCQFTTRPRRRRTTPTCTQTMFRNSWQSE